MLGGTPRNAPNFFSHSVFFTTFLYIGITFRTPSQTSVTWHVVGVIYSQWKKVGHTKMYVYMHYFWSSMCKLKRIKVNEHFQWPLFKVNYIKCQNILLCAKLLGLQINERHAYWKQFKATLRQRDVKSEIDMTWHDWWKHKAS